GVDRGLDLESLGLEEDPRELEVLGIVVHDEDRLPAHHVLPSRRLSSSTSAAAPPSPFDTTVCLEVSRLALSLGVRSLTVQMTIGTSRMPSIRRRREMSSNPLASGKSQSSTTSA